MAIKIIATDLDGTLMAPDHITVTPRTKQALLDAHEKGIKVAVATGRALNFTEGVTKQIPFADYVICSNGASVYDRNNQKFIYTNLVSSEITAQAIELLKTLPVYYNIYVDGGIYVQKGSEKYFENTGLPTVFLEEFASKLTVCDDISASTCGKGAELIDVFYVNDEQKKIIFDFFESNGLVLTSALAGVVSATAVGADKGTALGGLCKIMDIGADEAMAFGDASNDSTMLKYAYYSFAMENGDDICKASARFAAPSNAEDGVAQMVEKYALNK
ncbi:MAG: HAD family phosphatase [Ruminococcaceae bacterium]|nr:HAD family phosphatase [Oscillospiraceae bacterium]